jgi:hypothetical protein
VSHVFISYKREDELRVGRLARELEAEGLEVWWDRGLPGGESWHLNIEEKLAAAGCVIVVWSANSAGSDGGYVREEARRGLTRNILVPVLIDELEQLPLGFGEIQALDLTRWRGERRSADFQDLVRTIRAKLASEPLPAPQAPTRRIARRLMWGSASTVMLLFALLIAFNSFGVASHLCSVPGPQPTLSDACGRFGLGDKPSRAERLAWEARESGSCQALRDFVQRFPDGTLRARAADLLTARKVTREENWTSTTRSLALFQPIGSKVARDEPTARERSLAAAQDSAQRLCRDFGATSLYRFDGAAPQADKWNCETARGRVACGFDGRAQCQLQMRSTVERETCG